VIYLARTHCHPLSAIRIEGDVRCARSLYSPFAALILAGIGAWAASTSQARLETAPDVRIDPFRIMVHSKDLPVEEFVDHLLNGWSQLRL
jgi:hypothetical protein